MNCIACDSECVAIANYCHICGINLRLPVVSCAACDVQEGNSRCDINHITEKHEELPNEYEFFKRYPT